MSCREMWSLLAGLSLVALGIVCTGIFVNITNSGGRLTLQPIDVSVPTHGFSSFWCTGLSIKSEDEALFFNASVIPGRPRLDYSIRQNNTVALTLKVSEMNSNSLRYYLPTTSRVSLTHCTSKGFLMLYFLKDEEQLDDDCYESDSSECQSALKENAVELCYEKRRESVNINIDFSDYYLLLYKNPTFYKTNVHLKLTINRPFYDLSNRKSFCDRMSFCSLSLNWDSTESVIVQAGDHGSKVKHDIVYWCHPNYIAYALIFGGLPLLALIIASLVACCYTRRNKKQLSPIEVTVSPRNTASRPHKKVSKGTGESGLRTKAYGTFDDRTTPEESTGDRSLVPSAPPAQPSSENVPFISHEPPPSYEESVNDSNHVKDQKV